MKESKAMIKHSGPWFALRQQGQRGGRRGKESGNLEDIFVELMRVGSFLGHCA